MFAHESLGLLYGFLDGQSVQAEGFSVILHALVLAHGRVGHDAFLGIIALLAHVSPFHQWDDGQAEMLGKGIVSAVMGRYGHDGSCAIASQHVF